MRSKLGQSGRGTRRWERGQPEDRVTRTIAAKREGKAMPLRRLLGLAMASLLVISLTSCQTLLIEPEDSTARKAAKIAARVPMAVATLGITELQFLCARSGDMTGTPEERLAACAPEPCTNCNFNWNNTTWGTHQSLHAHGHHHHNC